MAAVLATRQIIVREYRYTMDEAHTGTLFLLDSPRHPQLAQWLSQKTGLKTPWHGSWRSPAGDPAVDLEIFFDYKGTFQHAWCKWTRVSTWTGGDFMTGQDYKLRQITMTLTHVWKFDDDEWQPQICF